MLIFSWRTFRKVYNFQYFFFFSVIRPNRAGQGRAGQGRAGQGRAGQGRAGQGRAGQGRAGQGRAVQCSAVQCSAVQCSAVQCSAVQCSASVNLQTYYGNNYSWHVFLMLGQRRRYQANVELALGYHSVLVAMDSQAGIVTQTHCCSKLG